MDSSSPENLFGDRNKVLQGLIQGRESANQLRLILEKPLGDDKSSVAVDLVTKILGSFGESISILNWRPIEEVFDKIPANTGGISPSLHNTHMDSSSPENLFGDRNKVLRGLIQCRESANQLRLILEKPLGDDKSSVAVDLVTKILGSFGESISILNWRPIEEVFDKIPANTGGISPFIESLFSHGLIRGCEDCEVNQIRNQVRSPIGDQRSVDPGESSKSPAAKDRRDSYKRRCIEKHDQGCQETEQVQRIQEAPDMNPTNYSGHHTSMSYSLDSPFQNPLLEARLLSFSSMTISTQDSEPYSRSFSSKTISTQYTSSCSFSASSVKKECGEETVQSNSLSGDLLFLPSQLPQPIIPFVQQGGPHEHQFFGALKAKPSSEGALRRWRKLALVLRFSMHLTEVPFQRNTSEIRVEVSTTSEDGHGWRKYGQKDILNAQFPRCYFRCTHKDDQGCQATKQVQRIQEAPHMYRTTYFGHHTCRSHPLNNPSQNPLLHSDPLEPYLLHFESKTITTEKEHNHHQYPSCPSSVPSVKKECGEETVQSNNLSGDLPVAEPIVWPELMPLEYSSSGYSTTLASTSKGFDMDLLLESGDFGSDFPFDENDFRLAS